MRFFSLLFISFLFCVSVSSREFSSDELREIGIALPGILFERLGSPHDRLSSLSDDPMIPFAVEDAKRILLNTWQISDKDSLYNQINLLRTSGFNEHYLYLRSIMSLHTAAFSALAIPSEVNFSELFVIDSEEMRKLLGRIWQNHNDLEYNDIIRMVFLWKVGATLEIKPSTVRGLDLASMAAIARWGYDAGYLAEEEAYALVEEAALSVSEEFGLWREFVESYIFGYFFRFAAQKDSYLLIKDAALTWHKLIERGGGWNGIAFQPYENQESSVFLQFAKDVYLFHKAIRENNEAGVSSLIGDGNGSRSLRSRKKVAFFGPYKIIRLPLDTPDYHRRSPVSIAATGDARILQLLLLKGFEFSTKDTITRTPLHYAGLSGSPTNIRLLLKQGLLPNNTDIYGLTPLHLAAGYNSHLTVNVLLEAQSIQVNRRDKRGRTPLFYAVQNINYRENSGLLTLKDARVNIADQSGVTPLMVAAEKGIEGSVLLLIQKGADIHSKAAETGKTPLHFACQAGNSNVVRLLLSEGALPNDLDAKERTSLHYAAEFGSRFLVKTVIDAGADIKAIDFQGETPLHYAARGNIENIDELVRRGVPVNAISTAGFLPLHFAAQRGDADSCEYLIKRGSEIDRFSKNLYTPLMMAVSGDERRTTELLLHKGAKTDPVFSEVLTQQQKEIEMSPLTLALSNGNAEIAELLVNAGADIDRAVSEGWTPLHHAARYSPPDAVGMLLSRGALPDVKTDLGNPPISFAAYDPDQGMEKVRLMYRSDAIINEVSEEGWTPLTLAAYIGNVAMVRTLLNLRVEINPPGNALSPLAAAASQGHHKIVSMLLERGADPNFVEEETGLTPLHYAVSIKEKKKWDKYAAEKTVGLLLENGARIGVKDKTGETPLFKAAARGTEKTVKLLLEKGANVYEKNNKGEVVFEFAFRNNYSIANIFSKYITREILNNRDSDEMTLFHRTAFYGDRKIVNLLLVRGADPNVRGPRRMTPLFFALRGHDPAVVSTLIRGGADPLALDDYGNTPLLNAIKHNAPLLNIADLLGWKGGKDKRDSSLEGWTPLHLAINKKQKPLLDLLLRSGASPNIPLNNGDTPLHTAAKSKSPEAIKSLLSYNPKIKAENNEGKTSYISAVEAGADECAAILRRYE